MTRISEELVPKCPDPEKDGLIWKNVSDEIKLEDGKANPFGWSQYRMVWKGEDIGWLESGTPVIKSENWQISSVVDPGDKIQHVFFFKGMSKEDWDAIDFLKIYSGLLTEKK